MSEQTTILDVCASVQGYKGTKGLSCADGWVLPPFTPYEQYLIETHEDTIRCDECHNLIMVFNNLAVCPCHHPDVQVGEWRVK